MTTHQTRVLPGHRGRKKAGGKVDEAFLGEGDPGAAGAGANAQFLQGVGESGFAPTSLLPMAYNSARQVQKQSVFSEVFCIGLCGVILGLKPITGCHETMPSWLQKKGTAPVQH